MFLLVTGIGFLVLGFLTQMGIYKHWWWGISTPVSPGKIVFGSFPLAFTFFLVAYLAESNLPNETRLQLANCVGIPMILLAMALTVWQPYWLKPRWFRWLEMYHGHILNLLWEEARKEGWLSWNERVKTQEGLEEWVAEVRRKHKLN